MAIEPAGQRVGAEESFSPGRKGAQVTRGPFGVKREVFAVGEMSGAARRLLRKRLRSELDAVRDLIRKGESLPLGAGPAGKTGAAVSVEDGRLLAAGPQPEVPVEADDSRAAATAAKRRKVPPLVEQAEEAPKRMAPGERERMAGRLASLAAALPDHVVAFLQNRRVGDADSQGDGGEMEMDMQSMKDGALFQLKLLLDKFAPESTPENPARAALDASGGVSCLSHHQNAGDKTAPVEEDDGLDVCGGASPVAIRDIAEEYGELVEDIGIQPLSPLHRKYFDLAEQEEYVDICGDSSPVVFPAKASETSSSPISSSSDDSDASSSDSGSDSSSDSDADESGSSQPPPPVVPNDDDTSAQTPMQAPEAVQVTEPEELQDQRAAGAPSPVAVQIVEPEELQDQGVAGAPSPEGDTPVQPSAPEMVQRAELEELQNQCAAPAPTVPPITGSPPAPAALPVENGAPAQPPEAVQIAEPEELQDQQDETPRITNLIARAQEALERRKEEEKERARKKARQELLKVERAALPNERIHPLDMELLGIAAFEHVVSSVDDAPTAGPQVNGGGILAQLGLFLKADDDAGEEQERQLGAAPGGADMDMEEGEIR